jgi:hypothetical protein
MEEKSSFIASILHLLPKQIKIKMNKTINVLVLHGNEISPPTLNEDHGPESMGAENIWT